MAVAWSAGQKVEVVRSFPFTLSSSASSSSPSHPAVHVCYKLGSVIEATEEHAVVQFTVDDSEIDPGSTEPPTDKSSSAGTTLTVRTEVLVLSKSELSDGSIRPLPPVGEGSLTHISSLSALSYGMWERPGVVCLGG